MKDVVTKYALFLLIIIIDLWIIASSGIPNSWKDWGSLATVIGAEVAVLGVCIARKQIEIHNSMRTVELIDKIYAPFVEKDMRTFYERIRKGDAIDWGNETERELLDKSLTIFDETHFLFAEGLLDQNAKGWEYFASEIQYFARNDSVWKYMIARLEESEKARYPRDIIPYTGLPDLIVNIPRQYKANPPVHVPEEYKSLWERLYCCRTLWGRIRSRLLKRINAVTEKYTFR
ncbi:MAG: hypothetical protein ABSG67_15685 [Thermoguttaceae bacterium]